MGKKYFLVKLAQELALKTFFLLLRNCHPFQLLTKIITCLKNPFGHQAKAFLNEKIESLP